MIFLILESFRPQQGLTIMNQFSKEVHQQQEANRFRPQQALTIMNRSTKHRHYLTRSRFPSPTGVNHYECSQLRLLDTHVCVSVPNKG